MIDITKRMKMAILTGDLKPRERLVESDLIRKFDVKRFAVRKAIHELANLGFVELIPNKGARVADFSDNEIEDIYRVRIALEYLAAELVIRNLTPEGLARLKRVQEEYMKAVSEGWVEEVVAKNEEFHLTFYELSCNRFLTEHLEKLTNSIFALRYSAFFHLGVAPKSIGNHQALISAVEEKDLERLKNVLKESIILPRMIRLSRKMGAVQDTNDTNRDEVPEMFERKAKKTKKAGESRYSTMVR